MIGRPPVFVGGAQVNETFAVVGSYVYAKPEGAEAGPAGIPVAKTAFPNPVSVTVVTLT